MIYPPWLITLLLRAKFPEDALCQGFFVHDPEAPKPRYNAKSKQIFSYLIGYDPPQNAEQREKYPYGKPLTHGGFPGSFSSQSFSVTFFLHEDLTPDYFTVTFSSEEQKEACLSCLPIPFKS